MRISDWSSDVCSSDLHGRNEFAHRPIAQPRGLRHDLVGCGVEIIGELDLAHWPQAVCAHAHRHAHDAALGQIGSASCRARVGPYGSVSVVAVSLNKKQKTQKANWNPSHLYTE